MTEHRIVRSLVMSVLVLGVAGCPPERPDDNDAGVGGSAMGGSGGAAAGGNATGGKASVPMCSSVASLPAMGTACTTQGESQCDASGNQCVCARSIWNCTTSCASTYPTEPNPGSACIRGAACNYPSGVSCGCVNSSWMCFGTRACPAAANTPITGDACDGSTGILCDYPNSSPTHHMTCACTAGMPDGGSTWTCIQAGQCPASQPAYGLSNSCQGFLTFCAYGSTLCSCVNPWVCGLMALGTMATE